jgi:nickel-type superoxide dismutase maturation protease
MNSNQRYHGHLKRFFPLAGVAMLLWWRWRPFRIEVEGESMTPTLEPGDWLVAIRVRQVRPGMLVVVEHPERPGYEMVKRVAAAPGDRIGDRTLGPDEYWVTGDNEEASTDSRRFGTVSSASICGQVLFRYLPTIRLTAGGVGGFRSSYRRRQLHRGKGEGSPEPPIGPRE